MEHKEKSLLLKYIRNVMILILIISLSITTKSVYAAEGYDTYTKQEELTNAQKVQQRNEYIDQVLTDPYLSVKYDFYNTDLSNYDDTMYVTTKLTKEEKEKQYKELSEFTNQLVAGESTDEQKLNKIYSWVVENIYYNYDYFYDSSKSIVYDAYGVYKERTSVCEGYSNLLRYMLLSQGIPAVRVSGMALGLGSSSDWESTDITVANHAWVKAYINGSWVNLDATWDSGNKYQNGTFSTKARKWRYYMCSNEYLSKDHMMQQVNYNEIDNLSKDGLFYEDGNYYFYSDGVKITNDLDSPYIFYSCWYDSYSGNFIDPDGKLYFDKDIVTFKDENLQKALTEKGYDTNGDGKISIGELNTDSLKLKGKGITDLSGLEYGRWGIEELDLSSNKISDISLFCNFKNLSELNLSKNNITDYSCLKDLEYLYDLNLSYNQITEELKSFSDYLNVTLKGNPIKVKKLEISKTKVRLKLNQSIYLYKTISPDNAVNTKVTWTSSNKKVAIVTSEGEVVAKGKGTAIITCMTKDGSMKKDQCKIIVY
ncbi:MAG TPA: transglutaminase domain-containing protein [Lachnospiraceae bacterium]|nr:transglutaminase domain-containing protein [Lachnospiraceae bacterium]